MNKRLLMHKKLLNTDSGRKTIPEKELLHLLKKN